MGEETVHPDLLVARLALARGWVSQEGYDLALESFFRRSGAEDAIEDALRASGLSTDRLRTLRGALRSRKNEAWIGDWRLIRRVGIGGMGSVFEARHRRTRRRAAVKILLPRLGRDQEFTARFLREARVLARISHPNVVHAYDAGRDGDFYFIAMELVDGEDLQRFLQREGCLSPARSTEVALMTARGLLAIAQAGLVHRDVKPANLLIEPGGEVKLADLGLFRDDLDRRIVWDGMVFGTPHYMSPEQVLGSEDLDSRSDLYSLGATWYHALLGRPPFLGSSPAAVARAQVDDLPVPPRDIRPDVPLAIDRLILALLEKDPARRPSGPAAALQAIEAALSGLAPRSRPGFLESRGSHAPLLDSPPAAGAATEGSGGGLRSALQGNRRSLVLFLALGLLIFTVGAWLGLRWGTGTTGSPEPPAAARVESVSPLLSLEDALGRAGDWIEGFSMVSRRALEESIPRPPFFRSGSPPAAPVSAPPVSASPVSASPVSASPVSASSPAEAAPPAGTVLPPEVSDWAARGSLLAMGRLSRALRTLPAGTLLEVLLRDGSRAQARLSGSEDPLLERPDGGPLPIQSLHPAVVVAWTGLDPVDPLPDGGVGLCLAEGFHPAAIVLARALGPALPPGVASFLAGLDERLPRESAAGAAEAFLEKPLALWAREKAARSALLAGRWEEAESNLSALLSSAESSAPGWLRRQEWTALAGRARLMSSIGLGLFARPPVLTDPLLGDRMALSYTFQGAEELQDFRFDGRGWALRAGRLVREPGSRPARGAGPGDRRRLALKQPLETLALFTTPLVVLGRWSRAEEEPAAPRAGGGPAASGRIAVGFAGRFVGLGPGEPVVWLGELEDGRIPFAGPRRAEGSPPGGKFRFEFRDGSVVADLPAEGAGEPRRLELSFPPEATPGLGAPGRVTIGLESGLALEELTVTGRLDPVWLEERISLKAK